MQFYCSEQMQNRELNTCKQDIYSFLHFLLPTNTEPYWTATEADMGTQNEVDESETAWYVQGYYSKLGGGKRNYKVATRNKQEAAFIRCVREM